MSEVTTTVFSLRMPKLQVCFVIVGDGMVKQAVGAAPFLQFPDFSRAFHVASDASNTGIGGVLYQPKTQGEHITPHNIVAIFSKILTESQRRYPAYKKELLGIVSCLRRFHSYIWGRNDLVMLQTINH